MKNKKDLKIFLKKNNIGSNSIKVLFIYTNINGYHDDCYSFGLASIVSVTKLAGHDIRVIIVNTKEDYEKVFTEINEFEPRVVGFSSVSSQFNFVKELAVGIKAISADIINVCGGVLPTIKPSCILEAKCLDAVFVGESEKAFIEFLAKVERGLDYKDTENLAYVENGRLIMNKLKPLIVKLDELPYPDRDVYPIAETLKSTGYMSFIFSRGCPYLCTYCSNHAIAKRYNLPRNYPRYRSPESSIREIESAINKFPGKKIFIIDDIFGLNKSWRDEFCEKYKDRIKVEFMCCLRANLIDEELIRLLKRAGCYRVSIGVESGNDYVRNEIMKRDISTEHIVRAFSLARKYGIQTNAINIIGIPGETEEMLWDTIKLNRNIRPTFSGVNIFYPYEGTIVGDYCFENELVNKHAYYSFSNERRETVLNYPKEYRDKLVYYRENWDELIYVFDIKKIFFRKLRRSFLWKYLRAAKRFLKQKEMNESAKK